MKMTNQKFNCVDGYGYQNNGMSYGSGNVDEYGQGMNYGSNNNNYGNTSYSGNGAPATPTKVLLEFLIQRSLIQQNKLFPLLVP